MDTATDPKAPRIAKTAEPEDIQKATGLAYLHSSHCLGSGDIMVSAMGTPEGKGVGNFILFDQDLKVSTPLISCLLLCPLPVPLYFHFYPFSAPASVTASVWLQVIWVCKSFLLLTFAGGHLADVISRPRSSLSGRSDEEFLGSGCLAEEALECHCWTDLSAVCK